MTLPNGCTREQAERRLAEYDMRKRGGYKNQVIAARDMVKFSTGMGVRDLRRWLKDNPVNITCYCGALVTKDDVLDPAYECANGHYFTRPEADETNICPECSKAGRKIGIACPECRELLPDA